jgi:DNA-binding transcriptional LysR family regulator
VIRRLIGDTRRLEVRDLLDVKTICEAGSFRKAAEVLRITQPTLSNRIAHLEDQLGVPLFNRDGGGSRPTELAQFIASRAAVIGRDASLLARDITRLASGQTGLIRVGTGPAPGRALLVSVVDKVAEVLPKLSLELHFGNTRQLGEQLLNRELDVVVCHPIEGVDPAIVIEQQLEIDNVIVAHPDHAMFKGPPPGISEVFRFPIAIPFLEDRYRQILSGYGIDIDQQVGRVVCSDFEMLVRLVTQSMRYFTAGPIFAFVPEIKSGQLRVLDTVLPFKHRVAMHTNAEAYPLPALKRVQQIIRDAFGSIVSRKP